MSPPSFSALATEGSADLHAIATVDGVYLWVSVTGARAFGWEPDDLVGQRLESFVHLDDRVPVASTRPGEVDSGEDPTSTVVFRFRRPDDSTRWAEMVSRVVELEQEAVVVLDVRDIEDRRASEADLRRQATTDPLTGAANRTVLTDRLRQALRRLERRRGVVTVLVLDLDHFKLINDSFGHAVGDRVLLDLTERVRALLRPGDTLARLGGDEFAILVEDMGRPEEAVALAQRIVEAGRAPFEIGDDSAVCTTSVGIALTADPSQTAYALVQEADLALYRAKERGRDRAEAFHGDLRARATADLGTERMLRRAIKERRLRIALQPIVDLQTGRAVAAEALVRVWDPQQPDLVTAASFIDVAEEAGLLSAIDDWMLDQAVEQVSRWRGEGTGVPMPTISLNVTARALAHPDFVSTILDSLSTRNLSTGTLSLELTEHVLMQASTSAVAGLTDLREAGVKVGFDNYGSGLASISYLRRVRLDFLKIDRSLVDGIVNSGTDRAVVGAMVELAHALEMKVVAEGVQTRAQAKVLSAVHCDRGQGAFFGDL